MTLASNYAELIELLKSQEERESVLLPLLSSTLPEIPPDFIVLRRAPWLVARINEETAHLSSGDKLSDPTIAPTALIAFIRQSIADQKEQLTQWSHSMIPGAVENALTDPLDRLLSEKVTSAIAELDTRVRRSRFMGRFDRAFFILLLITGALVGLLVFWSWVATPTANIEFNVGELIGGVLGGGGIAAAGTAYAVKTFAERGTNQR